MILFEYDCLLLYHILIEEVSIAMVSSECTMGGEADIHLRWYLIVQSS